MCLDRLDQPINPKESQERHPVYLEKTGLPGKKGTYNEHKKQTRA